MANQRRSGGIQKNTTPLATEGSVRRASRGILNIYDEDYATRLFEGDITPIAGASNTFV